MSQNETPLIVSGDLNAVPNGSSMHLIMGHKYDPTIVSNPKDPKFLDAFINVYETSPVAKRNFDHIHQNIEESLPEISRF